MQVVLSYKAEVDTYFDPDTVILSQHLQTGRCLFVHVYLWYPSFWSLPLSHVIPWIKTDRNTRSISIIPPFVGELQLFGRKLLLKVPVLRGQLTILLWFCNGHCHIHYDTDTSTKVFTVSCSLTPLSSKSIPCHTRTTRPWYSAVILSSVYTFFLQLLWSLLESDNGYYFSAEKNTANIQLQGLQKKHMGQWQSVHDKERKRKSF